MNLNIFLGFQEIFSTEIPDFSTLNAYISAPLTFRNTFLYIFSLVVMKGTTYPQAVKIKKKVYWPILEHPNVPACRLSTFHIFKILIYNF